MERTARAPPELPFRNRPSFAGRMEVKVEAAQAAYKAAAAVSARLSASQDVCVVCLLPCTSKACACSFMHAQCADQYVASYKDSQCRVCSKSIVAAALNKRPRQEESEADIRALKRLKERQEQQRASDLEWARRVAPAASHILRRHFRHARIEGQNPAEVQSELSFDTVVLSLVHSGPEYLDDLNERLNETMASAEAEGLVRRLHSIAEALTSSERVDCSEEFMSIFNVHLDRRAELGDGPDYR